MTVAITLLGLAALTFFIGRVVPIDPVLSIVGEKAPQTVYDRVYLELGLDKPIWVQFWDYIAKLLRGDFGTSFSTSRPVLQRPARLLPRHARALHPRPADRRARSACRWASPRPTGTRSGPIT